MADAVADEIDELKRDITAEFESKVSLVQNRVQNAQMTADKVENEQAKMRYQIERIGEEINHKLAQASAADRQHQSAMEQAQLMMAATSASAPVPEVDQKISQMRSETKKLFEQMKNIMQAQSMQIQTATKDIERLDSQVEGLRSSNSLKGDNEIDAAKKIIHLERDLQQLTKE